MKKLRIVFLGTPEFAVPSLDAIIEAGHEVAAVVTATDKPAGRGHKMIPSAVKQYAVEHGIPVLQPAKLRDLEFLDALRGYGADIFVVIAFRMLPEEVWAMPPMGTFNLHASLLPRYRGAAPINRAVMNGDAETGVTTFLLKHEIDTGDILRQESISIAPDENVGSVHDRLMALGARVTVDTLADLAAGTAVPRPQPDGQASAAPKIFREDCEIDLSKSRESVRNHVRGLSPYPAARITLHGVEMKVLEAVVADTRLQGRLYVECRRRFGAYSCSACGKTSHERERLPARSQDLTLRYTAF